MRICVHQLILPIAMHSFHNQHETLIILLLKVTTLCLFRKIKQTNNSTGLFFQTHRPCIIAAKIAIELLILFLFLFHLD